MIAPPRRSSADPRDDFEQVRVDLRLALDRLDDWPVALSEAELAQRAVDRARLSLTTALHQLRVKRNATAP